MVQPTSTMNRVLLIATAVVGLVMLAPTPTALADTADFIADSERNGEDSTTEEIRSAEIDLGMAICNLYATSGSNREVERTMAAKGDNPHHIAVWTVASVLYLCPQYEDLLPS
jgi:hypothetical protein